jgi:hypothetical protein
LGATFLAESAQISFVLPAGYRYVKPQGVRLAVAKHSGDVALQQPPSGSLQRYWGAIVGLRVGQMAHPPRLPKR